MIELTLAEDIPEIAKSGDTILLKDDKTFEIQNCNKPKKKIEKEDEIEKIKDVRSTEEKPTKAWFDECTKKVKAGNPDYTEEQVNATCGSMHYESTGMGAKKEYDPRIEKYLSIDKEKSWALLTKFYKDGHLDSYKVLKDFINKIATCPDVTDKFEKIMDGWMRDGEADTSTVEKIIDSCKKEDGNFVVEGDDKKTKVTKSKEIIEEVIKWERPKYLDEQNPEKRRKLMEEHRQKQKNHINTPTNGD